MQEHERLRVLAELDRLEVASRTQLGQHLIAMLEELSDTPAHHLAVRHRRLAFGQGRQLAFSVASRFDDSVHGMFRCWVQLRHHDLQTATGTVQDSITVAVLLTPRPDGHRHWDTSLIAVHGDLALTPGELEVWLRLFDNQD